jgi:hypothetical protein
MLLVGIKVSTISKYCFRENVNGRETKTDIQINRQMDRKTDRKTERQEDR